MNGELVEFYIPITDDAQNISEINEEILSYSTKYILEDFVEFFKSEMLAQGFTLGYEIAVADNVIIRFNKAILQLLFQQIQMAMGVMDAEAKE